MKKATSDKRQATKDKLVKLLKNELPTYGNIREEELKNKVAQDYFNEYDCTKIIGNIDFCVTLHTVKKQNQLFEVPSLLWAEAKKGKSNIYESIVQLILTIGKARTFDKYIPPAYLGAFDAEIIAFIPYNEIQEVFYQNDFNWNVTASNHNTKEFKQILEKVSAILDKESLLYDFGSDSKEIKSFVKKNFIVGNTNTSKTRIDKNNFVVIYNKWLANVKPTIAVNWENVKKNGIIVDNIILIKMLYNKVIVVESPYKYVHAITVFQLKHRYGNSVPKPYLSRINPVLISCQIQTKNIKHIWSNNLIKIKKPNNKNKWHNKKE